MLESQTVLVTILKEVIENYEQSIAEVNTLNNSALTNNEKIINRLKTDITALADIEPVVIKEILEETSTEENEKKIIYSYLETLICLLKLNKEKNTTYQISEEQKDYLNSFLEKVSTLEKKHQEIRKNNNTNLDELNKMCSKYNALLGRLEDENDNSYITNIELLKSLFEECRVDEHTKRSIMLNLMRYNQNIYLKSNT